MGGGGWGVGGGWLAGWPWGDSWGGQWVGQGLIEPGLDLGWVGLGHVRQGNKKRI